MADASRDSNRVPALVANSNDNNRNPVDLWADATTHRLLTTSTVSNTFLATPYDYVSVAYPTTSSEVFTFKTGGSGGPTVSTVTIVYTDDTKDNLSTVTRT